MPGSLRATGSARPRSGFHWPWQRAASPVNESRDPALPLQAPPGPRASAVVAIGDVHGCVTLLEQVLSEHSGSGAELIFLGDLIDRAPEPEGDRRVLRRVWQLQADPRAYGFAAVTVLRGNHEQVVLDVLTELGQGQANGPARQFWLEHGGEAALLPLLRENRAWLDDLPHFALRGDLLFVHAGLAPGVPLELQHSQDLLWIREPFLSCDDHGLPWTVVHGHSASPDHTPQRFPHRIGIDTGACYGGPLTALRFDLVSDDGAS